MSTTEDSLTNKTRTLSSGQL